MHRRDFVRTLLLGAVAGHLPSLQAAPEGGVADPVRDYLFRMREPDRHYDDDVTTDNDHRRLLRAIEGRLQRAQAIVGHGNFNVLGFDELLLYSRRYSEIGPFERAETEMLEQVFYEDARRYGFLGSKPVAKLTERVRLDDVVKVPGSGHYLYRGRPLALYENIRKTFGDAVVLTSGIRGVVKQMHLFLAKAAAYQGNLSLASRSLAPPGYSFHGIGDFDVGVPGWGERNFTEEFSTTELFQRLIDLGFVDIRYPIDNPLGVRFEPWHIRVG